MKRMVRISAVLLAAVFCMCSFSVFAADTQKCGDAITWRYDEDTKSLLLEGHGAMYDYEMDSRSRPWSG